jgi:hypothetical protein
VTRRRLATLSRPASRASIVSVAPIRRPPRLPARCTDARSRRSLTRSTFPAPIVVRPNRAIVAPPVAPRPVGVRVHHPVVQFEPEDVAGEEVEADGDGVHPDLQHRDGRPAGT